MQVLGYDERDGRLQVVLSNVGRADFFDVPRSMYESLIAAESNIEYFNSTIWDKGFEHRTYWRNLQALLKYPREQFLFFEPPEVTITSRSPEDDSPLHFACVRGDLGAVNMPLEAGAEPDAARDLDCTPLYFAVSFWFREVRGAVAPSWPIPDAYNELNYTRRGRKHLKAVNPKMVALFSSTA